MTHDPTCSGCPHCNTDMAAILTDAQGRRYESLSHRLMALTHRAARTLRVGRNHMVTRLLAVAAPPSLADALRAAGNAPANPEVRSDISPAPKYARSAIAAPPPCLRAAILKARSK